MVGVEYLQNLTYESSDGDNLKEDMKSYDIECLSELWFKAGIGTDINISNKIYVRITGLAGYRFNTLNDTSVENQHLALGVFDSATITYLDFEANIGLGFRL